MKLKVGDKVRYRGSTRVGVATRVAAGLVDVDFDDGDWSVVPEDRLEVDSPEKKTKILDSNR